MNTAEKWHGTTIVLLRKGGETIVAGDGQVSLGNTVLKSKAKKVRKIESRGVIAGFAGSTADALTLFERLEAKLEKHAGNLQRAAVELAKDWRSDKFLRRLEALMAVADKNHSFIISGTGDVLEPEDGIIGIGSGSYWFNELVTGSRSNSTARVKNWDLDTKILQVGIETGTFLRGETITGSRSGATYTVQVSAANTDKDKYDHSDEIEDEADQILDFSEGNPFGLY